MGAWGPALYSDDTTCEVRDAYIENLKLGRSDTEAYEQILHGYADLADDREVMCLVYFALADTAWKYGRLHEHIRARALDLIGQGGDISVWERDAPGEVSARRKVLRTLEARLLSKQPEPRQIKVSKPKPKKIRCSAPVGSVFTLDLPSKYRAFLALVGFIDLGKSVDPVFSILDWRSHHLPSDAELNEAARKTLPVKSGLGDQAHWGIFPKDERKNVMACLQQTRHSLTINMPYDPSKVVFTYPESLADDIDAHYAAHGPAARGEP
ncbi:hypothetical protein [Pseudoduganella sp. R-34]|uniref:hypothetical protein n=1 Tax=unclassified Pseudoduganella TaxID=2637179 RepID=UPI003CEF9E54